ncbi:MAG: hypothetical protein ACE5D4_03200 [Thermodesulfobacteriota bacterium]
MKKDQVEGLSRFSCFRRDGLSSISGYFFHMRTLKILFAVFSIVFAMTVTAQARVIDNNDFDPATGASGTVTDLDTGYIWQKDANCIAAHYPNFDHDDFPGTPPGTGMGDGQVTFLHAVDFISGMNSGTNSNT